MFDTIVTNVLAPGAFVGLFVALPLWWALRDAARDRQQPDNRPPDPLPVWIRTAGMLTGFGPFWYPIIRPRVRASAAADPHTKEGDPT
jgi:hypothetical protein